MNYYFWMQKYHIYEKQYNFKLPAFKWLTSAQQEVAYLLTESRR